MISEGNTLIRLVGMEKLVEIESKYMGRKRNREVEI